MTVTKKQTAAWYVLQAALAKRAAMALAVFVLLISAALAQTQLASTGGGILTSDSKKLTLPVSTITGQAINNVIIAGNLGTVNFVTPALVTGTIGAGGTFGAGGAFSISVPGIPLTYLATFVAGGTWHSIALANGSHFFELSASLVDMNGNTGAVIVDTVNVGTGDFVAPVMVAAISMEVN